jgi:hypothetical protein
MDVVATFTIVDIWLERDTPVCGHPFDVTLYACFIPVCHPHGGRNCPWACRSNSAAAPPQRSSRVAPGEELPERIHARREPGVEQPLAQRGHLVVVDALRGHAQRPKAGRHASACRGAVRVLRQASRTPTALLLALLVASLGGPGESEGLVQVGGPLDDEAGGVVGGAGVWGFVLPPPPTVLP